MTIIDAHVTVGDGQHLRLTPEDLLRQMDEAGIQRRIDRLRAPDRDKAMILGENAVRFMRLSGNAPKDVKGH